jgi:hypothetical protein
MNRVVACTKEFLDHIYVRVCLLFRFCVDLLAQRQRFTLLQPIVIRYVDQARVLCDTRYDYASVLSVLYICQREVS